MTEDRVCEYIVGVSCFFSNKSKPFLEQIPFFAVEELCSKTRLSFSFNENKRDIVIAFLAL